MALVVFLALAHVFLGGGGIYETSAKEFDLDAAESRPGVIPMDTAIAIYSDDDSKQSGEAIEHYSAQFKAEVSKRIEKLLNMQAYHLAKGRVSADGCILAGAFHDEDYYARDPAGQVVSMEQLIDRADEVFLLRIERVEPTLFVKSVLLTKYEATVVEHWPGDELEAIEPETELVFFNESVDVRIADKKVCVTREGISSPAEGELWLALGRQSADAGRLDIYNYFPVQNGEVLPQGYDFLDAENPESLARLRKIRFDSMPPYSH